MDYARFEALLRQHNTTVYRVSKETGIAPSTFSDWKNGRSTPKADKLLRIADFFGISTDSLFGSGLFSQAILLYRIFFDCQEKVTIFSLK